MKTFYKIMLIALLIITVVSCAGPPEEIEDSAGINYVGYFSRYEDKEYGIVCYGYYKGGIDCIELRSAP